AQYAYQQAQFQAATDWSADGRYILFDFGDPAATSIYAIETRPGAVPFTVVKSAAWDGDGHFSPDGRWIAFQSLEGASLSQVFVTPFPGPGPRLQVSTTSGQGPRWRKDGRELYYVTVQGDIMAVTIDTKGGAVRVGTPHKLFHQSVALS